MVPRATRRGIAAAALLLALTTASACGSSGSGGGSSTPSSISGDQLKGALLTTSDVPTGYVVGSGGVDSGQSDPSVTSPPPGTGAAASDAPTSASKSPACQTASQELAVSKNHGDDGSNAYADVNFQQTGTQGQIEEGLEAWPAQNAALPAQHLARRKELLVDCSPYVFGGGSGNEQATLTSLTLPTVGDDSDWFAMDVTVAGMHLHAALGTVVVGHVTVSIFVASPDSGTTPSTLLTSLTQAAVAKAGQIQNLGTASGSASGQ